ncbi:hypothetical protein [Staphylococcus pettenkoferi]|uniref:hypothetical protein n=1 Tax=Staphylococcus pettenkoferi TaxID=170573 RepID=UPI002275658C|nr:hypothetical protein [Staphylococcus pettenkoferi]MCY1573140.1 hypothetical protein [Staphylococcus pettenkoferi]MCY1579302.1 hypothetical protein [Staphylococcus pettenkoferi]
MKKYLITLVLISVLALSACGENKDSASKDHQDDKNTHKKAKEDTEMEHQDDHQKFGFKEDGDSNQSADTSQSNEAQSQGVESAQQNNGDSQQAENGQNADDSQMQEIEEYEAYLRSKKTMTPSDLEHYNDLVGDRELPGDMAERTGHNGVGPEE